MSTSRPGKEALEDVPGRSTGCGGIFSLLVNPFISAFVGLPASSGNNATLEAGLEDGLAEAVRFYEE